MNKRAIQYSYASGYSINTAAGIEVACYIVAAVSGYRFVAMAGYNSDSYADGYPIAVVIVLQGLLI
jgi:hypothetical protein